MLICSYVHMFIYSYIHIIIYSLQADFGECHCVLVEILKSQLATQFHS